MSFGGAQLVGQLLLVAWMSVSLGAAQSGIPLFTVDPVSQTVDRGDNVTLNCTYDAMDLSATDVTITWSGPSGIDVSNTAQTNDNGIFTSVLTLTSVTPEHAGMYDCSVENNDALMDITSMEANLTVSYYTVMFTMSTYSASEADGSTTVIVVATATGTPSTDGVVTVTNSNDTAVAGLDFTMVNTLLTFTTAETQNVSVAISVDNVLEDDETVTLSLTPNNAVIVVGAQDETTITIQDNSMVTIGFNEATYAITEGDNVTVCVELTSGVLDRSITALVQVDNASTATAPADFTLVMSEITFNASETMACVMVTTVIEMFDDGSETIVLSLTSSDPQVNVNVAMTTINVENFDVPMVTGDPESIENKTAGDDVMFVVTANGEVSYQWRKDEVNLTDDGVKYSGVMTDTLTVIDVNNDDEGDYSCMVTNQAGSNTSASASLTVFDPPVIMEQPMDMISAIGSNVTFTVVVSSTSPASYRWSLNGTEIDNATDSIYTVTSVQEMDYGGYSCLVTNEDASVPTREAQLRPLPPPEITVPPSPVALDAANIPDNQQLNVIFNCIATSSRSPDITWTVVPVMSGSMVPFDVSSATVNMMPDTTTTVSTLTVPVTNDSFNGVYYCVAQNEQGTTNESTTLSVITIEDVADQSVPLGLDATFTCSAQGSDRISYRWSHSFNGIMLATNFSGGSVDRVSGEDTANLTIARVRGVDETYSYTCTVFVDDIMAGNRTGSLSVLLFTITEGPVNQTVMTGGDVTLNCTAQNVPQSTLPLMFDWSRFYLDKYGKVKSQSLVNKTNANISPTETLSNNTFFSEVTITNLQPDDAGEYRCRVLVIPELFDEVAPVEAFVTVLFPPIVFFTEAEISDDPVDRYVANVSGDPLDIRCFVKAVPPFTFGELVMISPNGTMREVVRTSNNSEMTGLINVFLTNATLDQNGTTYECNVENELGNDTNTVVLIVRDVPDSVNHTNSVSVITSLNTVMVTWDTPNDNNGPITNYIITVVSASGSDTLLNEQPIALNSELFTVSNGRTSFIVDTLVPGNNYTITVRAVNVVGASRGDGEPFPFMAATLNDAQPIDFEATLQSESGLVFSWRLSLLAQPANIEVDNFTLMVSRVGGGMDISLTVLPSFNGGDRTSLQGVGIGGLEPATTYDVMLTANYNSPTLVSPVVMESFMTLTREAADMPVNNNPPSNPTVNTMESLDISWSPPNQQDFLVGYRVMFTVTSVTTRRRRQAMSGELRDVTGTSLTISDPEPYSNYNFDVFTRYQPTGSDDVVLRRLLPPFTFISAEGSASPPTITSTVAEIHSLAFSWSPPSDLNGILHNYVIRLMPATPGVPSPNLVTTEDTSGKVIGLPANAEYRASIYATTGGGNIIGTSATISVSTDFGVVEPVISSVNQLANNRLSVNINGFSDGDGAISHYFLVISRSSLNSGETNRLSTSSLVPYDTNNQRDFYVVYSERAQTSSFTREVGTGSPSTGFQGTSHPNPALEQGRQYFFFVRLFSAVNTSRFNDSRVSVQEVPRPVDPAVIIGPIAAFAIILLAVLVILLVIAFFMMRSTPKRRAYSPGQMDGLLDGKRKKKGHPIELRRTRLFSPTLNVGEENVFTSTGQPTTLICEASGTPAPEVSWTHNEEPLDKERFIQLADASLFINDTDMQDEGSYLVKATNSAGTVEQLVRVTVIRPVPPEPDSEHPIIPVGEFTEKIALLRANDDEGLEDEYADVELDWTFTSYAAKLNINKNKNRYVNIIPYDHSRVVMALQDNTPGTDYINASYIDGYNKPNAYIGTQGPIPSTFADFWRMIWELDSPTIVMVTNLKEEDKVKCHQYWPSYGTTTYGNIQVTLKNVENLAEYSIRTFNVTPLAGQSRVQMPVREVRQFHFLVWPDHGVPQYATALLSFRKRVVTYHPEKRGPMVVHCSAGVGRTGTFITIDVVMKQIEAEGIIDIFNFVRHMRFRRNYMVQTSPQYVFIHDAVLEAIMCGDSTIPTLELRDKIIAMLKENPDTGKNEFQQQVETLNAASPPDEDFDCSIAMIADNMSKNRSKEHLPPNDYRVVLSSDGEQSDYICASFVDNYRQRNAFMVTQAPMESTIGDFWRMIWEHKSAAIVMLTELEEDGTELCVKYWPSEEGEPGLFGAYQVELSEAQKDRGDYITRRFKVSPVDKPQESRMVTQFHFTSWSRSSVPSNPRSIIDLIDELQRVQRKSGNGPITVHCDDGISRTGAFCTLYSVLERVKIEQVVDVFQAIKHLRIQRAGLLSSVDQYIFIHKAVVEFLDTFSDYQNFK